MENHLRGNITLEELIHYLTGGEKNLPDEKLFPLALQQTGVHKFFHKSVDVLLVALFTDSDSNDKDDDFPALNDIDDAIALAGGSYGAKSCK